MWVGAAGPGEKTLRNGYGFGCFFAGGGEKGNSRCIMALYRSSTIMWGGQKHIIFNGGRVIDALILFSYPESQSKR